MTPSFEIALMHETAGFKVETIDGGHLTEVYTAQGPPMFICARRA